MQFEYRSLRLPGLGEESSEGADALDQLLRDRVRSYNHLGAEGWMLVAEHQDDTTYAVIATFRRTVGGGAAETPESRLETSPPAPAPAKTTPSYPTLQPDPATPDTYRLVWER